MSQFLAVKEVAGIGLIKEARKILNTMKVQGFRVPKIACKGTWSLMGYNLVFEDAQDATLPLGSKLVKMGDQNRRFAPTEDASMTIYSVASGEVLADDNPLASGDLFATVEDGRTTRHQEKAEAPPEAPKPQPKTRK